MIEALRLGSRGSQLAMWQAHRVKSLLEEAHPGINVEIIEIKTSGDRIKDDDDECPDGQVCSRFHTRSCVSGRRVAIASWTLSVGLALDDHERANVHVETLIPLSPRG